MDVLLLNIAYPPLERGVSRDAIDKDFPGYHPGLDPAGKEIEKCGFTRA